MGIGRGWRTFVRYDESAEAPLSRALLWRVFSYIRPYRGQMATMLISVLLITLIELIPPLLIRDLIDMPCSRSCWTRRSPPARSPRGPVSSPTAR